ncbi:LytR C-terminal domain-containing protein [Nocardioides panacisoli]|uniref:LytR C-terminal domain-containing protein n=1 Tax=Nocardioides panacisoli TaxID=627624 RepID=UPI001C63AB06|nr:LytR C-terminal domain-containing protein [Nocardioides panacisoli]QYJ04020.1 LytR C-terminal domain-containing protein [Nocardioides panacisoli]
MRDRPRRTAGARTERGTVLPSPVVILSVLAVAFAAVAFVVTTGDEPAERVVDQASSSESSTSSPATSEEPSTDATEQQKKKQQKKKPPPVQRGQVPVVVFNNTGITGLAGQVSGRATEVGWDVVAADNWYGTVPATTVYHGPQMKRAANQLALDLGVERVLPAIESMSNDRLTLILTGQLD